MEGGSEDTENEKQKWKLQKHHDAVLADLVEIR